MKFCESEGRIPRAINKKAAEMTEEEKNEFSLYQKWLRSDEKKIVDKYVSKNIKEIPKEDRALVETIRGFGYGLTVFEEVMKFCESEGRIPRAISKKAAERTEDEKNEVSLYRKWLKSDERKIADKYVGKNIEEIPEEDRELVEKIRGFGYIEKEKKDTAHIENKMIKNEKEEVIEHIIELQREDKALTNQIAIERSKNAQVKI